MFEIRFTNRAMRDLEKLPRPLSKRIITRIELLQTNPYGPDVKKLAGLPYFRLRVGNYRVIFSLEKGQLVVLIVKVGHRKKIYR